MDRNPPGLVTVTASRLDLDYTMPARVAADGYHTKFVVRLSGDEVSATTSLPFTPLLDSCAALVVAGDFHYPVAWHGAATWTYDIALEAPVLQHARMHVPYLYAITPSLAATPHKSAGSVVPGPPSSLPFFMLTAFFWPHPFRARYSRADFTPIKYVVNLSASALQLLFPVNQYNLVETMDAHTDAERRLPPHLRVWQNMGLTFSAATMRLGFEIDFPRCVTGRAVGVGAPLSRKNPGRRACTQPHRTALPSRQLHDARAQDALRAGGRARPHAAAAAAGPHGQRRPGRAGPHALVRWA